MTFNIVFHYFFFIQYLLTATYIFVFMAITATLAAYALAGSKNTQPQHEHCAVPGNLGAAAVVAFICPIQLKLFPINASMKFACAFLENLSSDFIGFV